MTRISLSETAHSLVRQYLPAGANAIDATLGNGHDTLFLARCVGESGHVHGFDVQLQALRATEQRLRQHDVISRATLIHASHAFMLEHIPQALHGRIRAIMFNLGYLPGADKGVITRTDSTLIAIDAACRLLSVAGILTILAYPGHAGGDEETLRLGEWCQRLDGRRFKTEIVLSRHDKPEAPRLFLIRKTD
ncbi:class I SAM-dependent methyltransferase [Methylomonas sp. LL1]|uniref:tRNA (mnm(5)s(2)U34)-methyltransferase n=1 Tax=Methylomonas sp. LL1 TaxID=2785785 RepID=UPI0018C42F7F|nr:class I SAM-dependent methyltransferase [Methylomonas sp. LL1]QPK64882.1 class I SAM-dependent methyltransferase [Methylomonas sp. LL1]